MARSHQSTADEGPPVRKTIAYVGGFELPDRNTAALRVLANARILHELGYEVVFFGISRSLAPRTPISECELPDHPFACWNLPQPSSGREWLARTVGLDEIGHTLRTGYQDRLAAIICYDYPAIAQLRLARLARRMGAVALAEATEWYGRSRFTGLHSLAKDLDTFGRMRLANAQMDGVIAASRFLRDHYAGSTQVLELPTVLEDFPQSLERRLATPDGQPKRLFFGATGFDPQIVRHMSDGPKDRLDKAIEILHRSLLAGARFELDIYGVTGDDYRSIYPGHHGILAELGPSVRFHGPQPRELAREQLARSDFSFFLRSPTIATLAGFPTKYSESIHVGTPVITNRIGSLTSYHTEGSTGHYIDFDNIEKSTSDICEIMNQSSEKIQSMKDHCRESRIFSYRSFVDPFRSFMESVRGHAALRHHP